MGADMVEKVKRKKLKISIEAPAAEMQNGGTSVDKQDAATVEAVKPAKSKKQKRKLAEAAAPGEAAGSEEVARKAKKPKLAEPAEETEKPNKKRKMLASAEAAEEPTQLKKKAKKANQNPAEAATQGAEDVPQAAPSQPDGSKKTKKAKKAQADASAVTEVPAAAEAAAAGDDTTGKKKKKKKASSVAAERAPAAAAPTAAAEEQDGQPEKPDRKAKKAGPPQTAEADAEVPSAVAGKRRKREVASEDAAAEPAEEAAVAEASPLKAEKAEEAVNGDGKRTSTGPKSDRAPRAFQRVKAEEWLDKKGAWDNSYEATFGNAGWGAGAQAILGQVRGKDFRHEKTKKKRGSYRGGVIDHNVNSFKFESDDE